jgi:ATP-binding cassette subfamily B protein
MLTILRRAFILLWEKGWRSQLVAAVCLGILAAVLATAQPILLGRVVDLLVSKASLGTVEWMVAAFVGTAFLFIAIDFSNKLISDRLAHRGMNAAMSLFAEAALSLPYEYHASVHSAWLGKVMATGVDSLFSLWLSALRSTIPNIATIALTVPAAIVLNPPLGCLFAVLVVLFYQTSRLVIGKARRDQRRIEEIRGEIFRRTGDNLANIQLVQAYNAVNRELDGLRVLLDERLRRQVPLLTRWAAFTSFPDSAAALTYAAIFCFGSWSVSRGDATVGSVVAFVGFASAIVPRLGHLQVQISDYLTRTVQLQEFFDVVDHRPPPPDAACPTTDGQHVIGHVRFEAVSFRYGPDKPGVTGVDIDAPPGRKIALVGHTGAGKSTILKLLLRFHQPTEGRVTIDGIDIRDMSLDFLRHQIAVVFQEPFMLDRSIADNLRLARPTATDTELEEVVRKAKAESFALRAPDGLESKVGERGARLSGGERQRLAIARALLKDAPILVLDEATSALDTETERLIQDSIDLLSQGKTTFIIAHRLSTIKSADEIIVLDRGRVAERGTFQALSAAGGVFSTLMAAQLSAPKP